MLINELSKKAGVSVHTVRYYENIGLIQGKANDKVKTNKYRNYDDSDVEKIEVIKEAQEVGFTLAEIKKLLEKWYSGNFPKEEQLQFFDAKIIEVESKITLLRQMVIRLKEVRKEIESGSCK